MNIKIATSFLLILILMSCKTNWTTTYKVETTKRSYYTDSIKIKNDSLYFSEFRRNKLEKRSYIIPYKEAKINNLNINN